MLKAVDMADPNVEHLGVMAYAAYFQWVKARPKPCDRLKITPDAKTVRVHNPVSPILFFQLCVGTHFLAAYLS